MEAAALAVNQAWGIAGAIVCLGLSATGSGMGTGVAAASAVGAWKKCYAQNKPAPFLLLTFVGAPITQTLYGNDLDVYYAGEGSDRIPLVDPRRLLWFVYWRFSLLSG